MQADEQKPRYEYKVVSPYSEGESSEECLNRLGAEGWELVAVEPATSEVYRTFYLRRASSPSI